jgi:hypothetical protein
MGMMYLIKERLLFGDVGGEHFSMTAVSGGRAGSKEGGVVDHSVANNPYCTGQKLNNSRGIVGGPIPCGTYVMEIDTTKKSKWIRLVPHSSNFMGSRGGFAIHGKGLRGSDGCIVPLVYVDLVKLWHAVKQNNGVELEVAGGDLSTVTV